MRTIIDNVVVEYDFDTIADWEGLEALVKEEKEKHDAGKIVIKHLEDDKFEVLTTRRGNIRRLRRITGYLTEMHAFNDSKLAELKERSVHGDWKNM